MTEKTPPESVLTVEAVTIGSENELLDLLPKITLFPGEDEITFDGLREAILLDLSPCAPYESVVVENIVTVEWEAIRHRQMRDDLIRIEFRKYTVSAFMNKKPDHIHTENGFAAATKLSNALMGNDAALRAQSLLALEKIGVNAGEILAKSYKAAGTSVEIHERKLAEIEIRRRRLREDFDRLRAALKIPVMDAELLDNP